MDNNISDLKLKIKDLVYKIVEQNDLKFVKELAERLEVDVDNIFRIWSQVSAYKVTRLKNIFEFFERIYNQNFLIMRDINTKQFLINYQDEAKMLLDYKKNNREINIFNQLNPSLKNTITIKKKCAECGKMHDYNIQFNGKYYCSNFCYNHGIDYIYQLNKKIKKELNKI